MARHGVQLIPDEVDVPAPIKLLRKVMPPYGAAKEQEKRGLRLRAALTKLGPTYIKLGQFLATRDDLVGKQVARDLTQLQDRLAPFPQKEAEREIEAALDAPVSQLFTSFGPAIAAASIAQVHKATTIEEGETKTWAVKILRPGVEQKLARDMESFFFAARMIERLHAPTRRLKPVAVVDTLAQSVELEIDLRMEASALSEMAENIAQDPGFRVPSINWAHSTQRVLTIEWIDGTPMSDIEALRAAGHDLKALSTTLIRSFLRHAMRDGFFHADMHQGNLLVDAAGDIVAIDFGIMGRLGMKERRFLAEILYGFITRNYHRVAEVHLNAGYVPAHHGVEQFAQALRAIGEPLMDRGADEISMGRLLGQLFQVTDMFDMETRPELILLQKTMVVVEGVGRTLDPKLNIWTTAEPVVKEWMESQIGAEGRLADAAEGAASLGKFVGDIPDLLSQAERTAHSFSAMAQEGLRLDEKTIDRIARAQAKRDRWSRTALWIGALALVVLAISQL